MDLFVNPLCISVLEAATYLPFGAVFKKGNSLLYQKKKAKLQGTITGIDLGKWV